MPANEVPVSFISDSKTMHHDYKPTQLNPIGLIADMIILTGRIASRHLFHQGTPGRIALAWKRADVCTETKERNREDTEKLYPRLIKKGWNGKNRVFYYRLPTGLSFLKVHKAIHFLESDLKCEVIDKLLENHPKAHFSLTILSGHLLDYVEFNDEIQHLKDNGLWLPLGWSRRGLEQINLEDDNSCHLLIGGGTGAGKSTLAKMFLVSLHVKYTREDVVMWLCDLKHGNDIAMLGDSPLLVDRVIEEPEHVDSMADDLSDEIKRRYTVFKQSGCRDIKTFNANSKRMPHLILFVDEYTRLEGKKFQDVREKLSKITGEGRAAGVHVIVSCHRPTANLIPGTMKNNMAAVVAFRSNPVSARVLLGEDEWESAMTIDKEVPGRALFKWKDEVLMQVPFLKDSVCKEIMSQYQKPKVEKKVTIERVKST